MCGIAGIVDFRTSKKSVNQDTLKKMSDIIFHRGPDSDGQWISNEHSCGLAFRRLAIIDLSANGNQPMVKDDGSFAIVFNGEVYNHQTPRKELIKAGYSYKSGTDTETLLNGYQEWGKDLLNKIEGMWSFAIWDEKKKELFASRDRLGKKPFYYYYKDGLFVFGSEIKSILCHPEVSKEVNIEQLPYYLNYGISNNQESLFKGIKKLPAGHYLHLKSDGSLKIERYWSPIDKNNQYNDLSEKETTDEILRLLRIAIKDRMMSDVPFGVFLSGGIDSSLNVALMHELMDRPIDTYTVGFKELSQYNELEYATKISKMYNTNHHEILIDEKESFDILEKLPWYEDEPNGDPVCIPLYFLSKLTRESGTIVVQVGEGSDEQFIGYSSMLRDYNFYQKYWKTYGKLPNAIKKMTYAAANPIFKGMNQLLALDYLKRASYNQELYWGGNSIFSPTHLQKMFTDDYKHLSDSVPEFASMIHKTALTENPNLDYLQRMTYVELFNRLPEMLLMRVDKIGMAHSIEARVPFLDYRLIEFSMKIKPDLKVPNYHTTKNILKKAVEGILPNDIIHRKKQGFWAPVNEWLRGQWYDYAKNEIFTSNLLNSGIFEQNYLKSILEDHKNSKANNGTKIYFLLMLALWYKNYFGNEKLEI
jgi:asparagine synthase (glutamine-hydrolysing)